MAYFETTTFWTKLKDTISLLGTGGQITLLLADSYRYWNYIMAGATIAGILISMWMDDKNGDGVVDLFEKTITATVKTSDPDAKVEVSTDVVKKPE